MIQAGERVLVPSHKSWDRTWSRGTFENVTRGIARVRLDDGRVIHTPIGLLSRMVEARGSGPVT